MTDKLIQRLLGYSEGKRSVTFKLTGIVIGGSIFLIIIPAAFIGVALFLEAHWPEILKEALEFATFGLGAFFLAWAVMVQWNRGKGTPNPVAPTQKLVITGPYKLCRNPIQLGACLVYFGTGAFLGTLMTGIIAFSLGMITGSFYHKFIEEKELEARFGEDYEKYREITPFVFPKIFK